MSAAPPWRRRWALARWESGLLFRNGEQILLAFIIPIMLLIALQWWRPEDAPLAVVLTASLLATAFTSLAIGLGFERRSGSLRYLATTPLTTADILIGKVLSQGGLALASAAGVLIVGVVLGMAVSPVAALVLLPLAAVTFACWAFWLAGTLRAEAVLAVANATFLVLVVFGGVVVPAAELPAVAAPIVRWLPSALLADGLREFSVVSVLGLLPWLLIGGFLARRRFRWDA
jgi:ABC-2 type transport system permease protein